MGFVQNQFFPSSDRPEVLVDLDLPQNASINETRKVVDRLEASLKDDPDILRWSTYIGEGAIRFYLPLDQQLQNPYYAQLIIVSKGLEQRAALMDRLNKRLRDDFVGIGSFVQTLAGGAALAVPGQRQGHRPGAQACHRAGDPPRQEPQRRRNHLRLERAGQGPAHRYRPGQGATVRPVVRGCGEADEHHRQWRAGDT